MKCVCNRCGKIFEPKTKNRVAKYCSFKCNSISNGYKKGHQFHKGGEKGWIKKGQRLSPNTEFKKKTGKWMSKGYFYTYAPKHPFKNTSDGVAEHRLIVEKYIGRYLTRAEEIHHLNGNKIDNRVENLIIVSRNNHAKLHWSPITKKYASMPSYR